MDQPPLRILLADDDEDDRLVFTDAMSELRIGTDVNTVNDGVELMTWLQSNHDHLPQLIFLDLNMPRKDGMQCLAEIRENPGMKDVAVAIYSTSASEEDIEETFVRGANIYIRKPNDFNELKNILEEVITINWQYHTSGLNRENFFMSL